MTSAWRLQLRKGAFRGVPFFLDKHEFEGGRRVVDHLFPYKDTAWTEDLGLRQRVYKLNLYVVGDDYFPQRDALLTALEKGGAAILSHPYLGNKTVEASDVSLTESTAEGGIALFTVTFRETGRVPSPEGAKDLFEAAKEAASATQLALQRAFAAFSTPSTTTFVFESATALFAKANDALSAASNLGPNKTALQISDLAYSIRNLRGNARSLLQRPDQLAAQFTDAVKLLTDSLDISGLLPEDNRGRVSFEPSARATAAAKDKALRGVFQPLIDYGKFLPPKIETTVLRKQEAKNQDLMRQLVTGTALAEAVIVAAGTTYSTLAEALENREYLATEIAALMEDPSLPDEVYDALQDISAVTVEAVPAPGSESPSLAYHELSGLTPSLVVSYDLYGDLFFESDIIVRNGVRNPAFISPVKPLEVLAGV